MGEEATGEKKPHSSEARWEAFGCLIYVTTVVFVSMLKLCN